MKSAALLALMLLVVLPSSGRAQALTQFPQPVIGLLKKHKLAPDNLSVYVQDVRKSAPLLTVNAQHPRNPASVMKLITTLIALHELGPSFRFRTDVYADSPAKNGVIKGNLYLKGNGDPFLVTESFWRLLKNLRQTGIEQITGDLVIDGSYFRVPETYRGDFDGRPYRAYNVQPHATLVNFFATRFKFFADPSAARVRIVADPPMSTLTIDNQIKLTKTRCSRHKRDVIMLVQQTGPRAQVRFSGSFPESCGPYEILRAVADPVPYVFGAFKPMWTEMGGRIDGVGREGLVPESAVRVFRSSSRPLAELIRLMNKYSNNVMTRNLLMALGAKTYGAPGTEEKGQRAIADWLLLQGVKAPELRVDNGSGLSRKGQLSALTLARVLLKAWKSEFMSEFVSTLPLSALDGTLRKRFKKTDLKGKIHMKTGLLNGARSIAGFMQTRSGRNLVVVSLHNQKGVQNGSGTRVQDALLKWLYEQ
ncbi:MAG: D-alanyl-D-alanine carboxypeptidase/D-alanyl-D-alanine-endopeptidase (penicillin-binding protein 4) [Gammaproteobacteria bacterium]